MSWISITDKLPDQKQPVFYYFGGFDCVYAGFYVTSQLDFGDGRIYDCNTFYGDKGGLGDDVTYWQPRAEGQEKPERPSEELRRLCRYHPESFEEIDQWRTREAERLKGYADQFKAKGFKVKGRRR